MIDLFSVCSSALATLFSLTLRYYLLFCIHMCILRFIATTAEFNLGQADSRGDDPDGSLIIY